MAVESATFADIHLSEEDNKSCSQSAGHLVSVTCCEH